MKTRLAIVACRSANDGVWSIARGNEVGISIDALGEGEHIRFEVMVKSESMILLTCFESGVFDLPHNNFDRYRVAKGINGGPGVSTTVEILLNGAPNSSTPKSSHSDISVEQ